MEPIRYLQPATFPPPAPQHNSQEEVYRKRKCDTNNETIASRVSRVSRASSASRGSSHNATTPTSFTQRQNIVMWSLAVGAFMSVIQAIHATPVFVDNPGLAQFQSGRNIRHLPCVVRKSGLSGTCMFAIDCIKQNGTHLGTCIDRFYFGSCCQIKDENNLFPPEISDNSIDQNTISHFVHESTTLPTSALYKPTTDSHQASVTSNNTFSTSSKTSEQPSVANKTISTAHTTTTTTTTTLHTTRHPSRPTNIITSSSSSTSTSIHTKKPTTSTQHSTHRPSQFVVRTTKKPTPTVTTPTATATATATTQKTSTTKRTTTTQTTLKPSRRKPTTTTTALPVLTTDEPKSPSAAIDNAFQTTQPPKFFTFQMVETTTPTMTEPTNFIDFTTTYPPTFITKRPHKPSNHSKPSIDNKTSAATSITTTIETSTQKVRPTPPVRNSSKPKPTPPATIPVRSPSTTKKPSTKRPKPSAKPAHTTQQITTTDHPKPTKPIPIADEIPPTTTVHKKPSASTAQQVHTTHSPSAPPKPTANITKVPKPIVTSTKKKPSPTINTTTATPKPPTTTLASTTAKITEATAATVPPSKAPVTTSATFKPGLITWTNEEAEPGTNATVIEHPSQWLPVSTIAPEIPLTNKTEAASPASISTTSKPTALAPSGSTEKIIVSVATSVSEAQRNETIKPPKPTTTTTSKTTTRPISSPKPTPPTKVTSSKPQPPPKTTQPPKTPTIPSKPNLGATTIAPPTDAVESTTIDYEASGETSTEGNWATAATGSTTTIDGITEDYNGTTVSPTATTLPPNTLEGVDYRQICGRRMFPEPRIVGGSNAAFGRWPWQISLRQWRTSTYLHKCGAALLNENWAITAAHCVDNVPPSDLLLRLGEYDLAEEEEPYGYQERRVQIVASHPQFDPRTFEYDLALLRFYEPVVFQPNIIPVCVPNSDEDFIGQTAFVTGWGRLYEDGPLPSVLQEVAVPVINNTICETMYRAAGYIEHIPHIFICAGWKKGGYDSCEGDSGGPMVIQREDDKRFQLGGVISWGIGCAEANQPGVYTRISEFRDWINQILQF